MWLSRAPPKVASFVNIAHEHTPWLFHPCLFLSQAMPLEASEESGLSGAAAGSSWQGGGEAYRGSGRTPAARWEAAGWEAARSAA